MSTLRSGVYENDPAGGEPFFNTTAALIGLEGPKGYKDPKNVQIPLKV